MDRQQLNQDALDYIVQKRTEYRTAADNGEDDTLDEKDRRNREHVLGPLARVKEDDDVIVNGDVFRVIGAARGEGWFTGFVLGMRGPTDVPIEGANITDRAPADAEEEALPIFLEEESPEPAPEPEP